MGDMGDPPGRMLDLLSLLQTRRSWGGEELATRLEVPPNRIALGGRSFGGRMCSLAVAEGVRAALSVSVIIAVGVG